MRFILFIILLFTPLTITAQWFSVGAEVGYVTYHKLNVEKTIEGTYIIGSQSNNSSFMDGLRYAINAEFKKKKFSGELELAYSYNIGGSGGVYFVNNWNNPSNTNWAGQWAFGHMVLLSNLEVSPSLKYHLFKCLTLQGGFGVMTQKVKDPSDFLKYHTNSPPQLEELHQRENNIIGFVKGIEGSFLPYVGTYKFGATLQLKNLYFEVFKENSFTPVSKNLIYNGNSYTFHQNSTRYVISVGYRLRKLPFKRCNPTPL